MSNNEYRNLMIAVLEMARKEIDADESEFKDGVHYGLSLAIWKLRKSAFLTEEKE